MTRGENRMAKLIRVEKNPRGLSYLDTYYFECLDCGKEYFRHANNKRISPYCGKCQRKHENEKQKERLKAKKNQSIIEELEKIKAEIVLLQSKYKYDSETEYYKVGRCEAHEEDLEIIDNYIKKLKGENNETDN